MINRTVVLIINHPELLKAISGVYLEKEFTVFPFYHFDEVPPHLFKMENLFVWEIGDSNPADVKWLHFLKEKNRIRFIIIDFLRDHFVKKILESHYVPKDIYEKSYKVRDLISMSLMLFDATSPFIRMSSYLNTHSVVFSEKIPHKENYLEEAEKIISSFLKKNGLEDKIKNLDLFYLALGEVVENFVSYHYFHLGQKPDIYIEYGFDNEKLIIGVKDDLGKTDFFSLFKSFIRQTSISPELIEKALEKNKEDEETKKIKENYNKEGIYIGKQGRGMNIVKKGVHRLISIVKKEDEIEGEITKRTQFIFIVYFDKKIPSQNEDSSSVNMLVFF